MRRRFCACLALLVLGVVCSATAQSGGDKTSASEYFGEWTGGWDGGGASGGFDLTLEKGKDGAPGGRVSVTGEPAYNATLKALAFNDKKMAATYDFPPDERMEVVLAGTFDGKTAKGTWSVRGKNGEGELAAGNWTVTKK